MRQPTSGTPSWAAYDQHHDFVRRALRRFGVAEVDVDDVCHDVFMIAHARSDEIRLMAHPEVWLHEVARRTASAYRRRAFRRSEIPSGDPEQMAVVELEQDLDPGADRKLRKALFLLEPQRREMLLYADLTDVSVSDLAVLLDCDRKTARKRLLSTRQRVERLLEAPMPLSDGALAPSPECSEPLFNPQRVAQSSARPSHKLQIVAQSPMFGAAVFGRVFMTVWRRASLEEIETMVAAAARVYHASGGQFAYLTLVEAGCPPPAFSSRTRLAQIMRDARHHLSSYATVLTGGPSAFVVPIMNVVFFLSGTTFPVRFFRSLAESANWTSARTNANVAAAELARALEALRCSLDPLL